MRARLLDGRFTDRAVWADMLVGLVAGLASVVLRQLGTLTNHTLRIAVSGLNDFDPGQNLLDNLDCDSGSPLSPAQLLAMLQSLLLLTLVVAVKRDIEIDGGRGNDRGYPAGGPVHRRTRPGFARRLAGPHAAVVDCGGFDLAAWTARGHYGARHELRRQQFAHHAGLDGMVRPDRGDGRGGMRTGAGDELATRPLARVALVTAVESSHAAAIGPAIKSARRIHASFS